MTLTHLNSDQRQYFWISLCMAGFFAYLAFKVAGLKQIFAILTVFLEGWCAISIYRERRSAPWFYLLGCFCLIGMAVTQWVTRGYSHSTVGMLGGALLSTTGFYWLRQAMEKETPTNDSNALPDLFELPEEHEGRVDSLVKAYARTFGDPQWVHHIVPKPIWLHRYADYVVTIPPTKARPTWLYGTLLVSALSGSPVEFILERPEEDAIGAIGTLSCLTEYFLDNEPLEEWNTMGNHPFFGEKSAVRGLLFCRPPQLLADTLQLPSGPIELRYVAGITEDQLSTAQAADDAQGDFAGAKALHAELRIATSGIANLPN